jgi:hypothetical protein
MTKPRQHPALNRELGDIFLSDFIEMLECLNEDLGPNVVITFNNHYNFTFQRIDSVGKRRQLNIKH